MTSARLAVQRRIAVGATYSKPGIRHEQFSTFYMGSCLSVNALCMQLCFAT